MNDPIAQVRECPTNEKGFNAHRLVVCGVVITPHNIQDPADLARQINAAVARAAAANRKAVA